MELQFEPTRVYGLDGGGRLVAEITLEQIRKNGGPPAATCTYAVSWLEKHPEQA